VSSPIDRLLASFGIHKMPWIMRVYLLLFTILIGVLLFAASKAPANLQDGSLHPLAKLFDIAADSLKIVLGALLGGLSMAAQRQWKEQDPKQTEPPQRLPGRRQR
jgi:hypothetical protein